jgi:hypothetical protein
MLEVTGELGGMADRLRSEFDAFLRVITDAGEPPPAVTVAAGDARPVPIVSALQAETAASLADAA